MTGSEDLSFHKCQNSLCLQIDQTFQLMLIFLVLFLFVFFSGVAGPVANEDTDEKILPYCDISKSKKSLGEMEQEFLEALQVPNTFTT